MRRVGWVATLVVPSLVAGWAVLRAQPDAPVLRAASAVLAGLWFALIVLVAIRTREAERHQDPGGAWGVIDLLTGMGRATLWGGALALVGGVVTGWASLSVLGVLGLGCTYLAAGWMLLAGCARAPWRRAQVTRAILPVTSTEGEPLREEVKLSGIAIPPGMRLFAAGRPARRSVMTRYALGSESSRGEIELESRLGCVPRGEHRAPPLSLWFGDVLGLTRSPVVFQGGVTEFTVLPSTAPVDGVRELLGRGGDAATSTPTERLPTEGTFRIREYVPGDDARRIHWVRSLQVNELVVRLPDEIPPADPVVRLVLDTHLWGAAMLTCAAPDHLLDACVRVWLGVAKALAASGSRVTLVSVHDLGNGPVAVTRPYSPRATRDALRLGARAVWQSQVPLETLLDARGPRQVVVSCRPRPIEACPDLAWVFVPEATWTAPEPWLPTTDALKLPFPMGSAENRFTRRRRERERIEAMWRDRMMFHQMVWWRAPSGAYLAHPVAGRVALQVIP